MHLKRKPQSTVLRQRGQAALILLLLVLGVGVTVLVYSLATPAKLAIEQNRKTTDALAQARGALIGYAAAHSYEPGPSGHPSKPGILPCPDMDNDGTADAPCGVNYTTVVGRLPWKTLGLPDLRDAAGECLWYAVSGNYKNSGPTGESGAAIINPNTPGTLAVHNNDGILVHAASAVVAIVFSPGPALSGQNRNAVGTTVCGGNTTALNYLDTYTVGSKTYNNATGISTPSAPTSEFISVSSLGTLDNLNDQMLPITTDALFNVVNVRVAKEAIAALEAYRNINKYYPYANDYGSANPYYCVPERNRGRFPSTTTGPGSCGQAAWPSTVSDFETWFKANEWSTVTHYAMSKVCGQFGLGSVLDDLLFNACDTLGSISGSTLKILNSDLSILGLPNFTDDAITVTGVSSNVRALVIVTGPTQTAPPCTSAGQCMEDAANTDGNGVYSKPSRFPSSNDRMALTCATNSSCSVVP